MAAGVQWCPRMSWASQSRGRAQPPDRGTASSKGTDVGQPLHPEVGLDLDYAVIPNSTENAMVVPRVPIPSCPDLPAGLGGYLSQNGWALEEMSQPMGS